MIYPDVKDRGAHALLVANLCDLEHRLSLGTNDKMQLAGMVGSSRPRAQPQECVNGAARRGRAPR